MKKFFQNDPNAVCACWIIFSSVRSFTSCALKRKCMSLKIFAPTLKLIWLITMLLISLIEILPFNSDNVPVIVFYSYKLLKAALFVAFGFETPLTFWRFDSIRAGLLMTNVVDLNN